MITAITAIKPRLPKRIISNSSHWGKIWWFWKSSFLVS